MRQSQRHSLHRIMLRLMTGLIALTTVLTGAVVVIPKLLPSGDVFVIVGEHERNMDLYLLDVNRAITHRLTWHPARDADPWVSPDQRTIVFVSERDANTELYLLNLADGAITRLTYTTASEQRPAWSPDGLMLAYSSIENGNADIYVMNVTDGQARNLTQSESDDSSPSWSPDGSTIVYTGLSGFSAEIYTSRVDDRTRTQLTGGIEHRNWFPVWSPGDDEIALLIADGRQRAIHVIGLTSHETRNISGMIGMSGRPAWSPDGHHLAFSLAINVDSRIVQIHNTQTGQLERIIDLDMPVWDPQWIDLRS